MKISSILNKNFPISQAFGKNPEIYQRFNLAGHNGLDFAIPEGELVFAPFDGEIYTSGYQATGYGKYIKFRNENFEVIFGHLSFIFHFQGTKVKAGQALGLTGNTGFSTGPHLHFGLRELESGYVKNYDNGYLGYLNPENFFDGPCFDTSLSYSFEIPANPANEYDDVSPWAKDAYDFVIEEGVSNGERPQDEISREEFWLSLLRFSETIGENWEPKEDFEVDFLKLDISNRPSEWAEDAYFFVVSEEISNGERPKEFVTREEVWAILHRFFLGYSQFKSSNETREISGLSSWALTGYHWVVTNEISNGERPKDYISREEIWTTLLRCFEILED